MIRIGLMLSVFTAGALAQTPATPEQEKPRNGSIGGIVKDAGTGAPLAEITVSTYINARYSNRTIQMGPGTRAVTSFTDSTGRYRLSDLPPAQYWITTRGRRPPGPRAERIVTLRAGQDLTLDLLVPAAAVIAGRVLDQNKEPVADAWVHLLAPEYADGVLAYFVKNLTRTDDQGEYRFETAPAGIPYVVLAEKRRPMPAISEAPTELKLRKPVYVRTYFPSVGEAEGGVPMMLRPGERREGVDIRFLRAPSYCIDGTIEASHGPAPARFFLYGDQFSGGTSSTGGVSMLPPGGTAGPDGKFRICDLNRGQYRLMVQFQPPSAPPEQQQLGSMQFGITNRDLTGLRVYARPGVVVRGRVAWEGDPPDPAPTSATMLVALMPSRRMNLSGESNYARPSVPGEFSIPSVLLDEYSLMVRPNITGVSAYVKDITYGGISILNETLKVGSVMGEGELRVVLAHDGGSIQVKVADKDGNPVPDAQVVIFPALVASEAALAAKMITGATDQDGFLSHGPLAPGKYAVLGTDVPADASVAFIARLWSARARAKPVELAPNGSAQVTLELVRLE